MITISSSQDTQQYYRICLKELEKDLSNYLLEIKEQNRYTGYSIQYAENYNYSSKYNVIVNGIEKVLSFDISTKAVDIYKIIRYLSVQRINSLYRAAEFLNLTKTKQYLEVFKFSEVIMK